MTTSLGPIDRTSSVPLYRLIAQAIRNSIDDGRLTPNQELPSEGELCNFYGVSKVTIRQALAELVHEAVLYRPRPRSLLTVSPRRHPQEITRQTGFFVDDSTDGEVRTETRVLGVKSVPVPDDLAPIFGVAPRAEFYWVERLHCQANEPMALQVSHLDTRRFPDLLAHDLSQSLQRVCERQYGYVVTHKVQRLRPRLVTPHEADLLGVNRRIPIIEIERNLFAGDKVLEHTTYVLRPDRHDLVMHIRCTTERESQ